MKQGTKIGIRIGKDKSLVNFGMVAGIGMLNENQNVVGHGAGIGIEKEGIRSENGRSGKMPKKGIIVERKEAGT
jgi:hypothetical protein